jgi:D-cysteine desulfhydrase
VTMLLSSSKMKVVESPRVRERVAAETPDERAIIRRFPALAKMPRVSLGVVRTPVERVRLFDGRTLLIKRDDLSSPTLGGNKVRALEWLLGDVRAGDSVLTVGPRGSTHALTTAIYARLLGARPLVVRWNQHMNPAARRTDARLRAAARVIDAQSPVIAYVVAAGLRLRPSTRWIAAGGATPVGILGHVNAAMDLAAQVTNGECEAPERVVVPFGTGATAAGLVLGFLIARISTRVVAVRVVPRIVGRRQRVITFANRTAELIERVTRERLPRVTPQDVVVEQTSYAGGYGKPLGRTLEDERVLNDAGVRLDDTYCRKAFAAALSQPGNKTLLWLTFDGRLLQNGTS